MEPAQPLRLLDAATHSLLEAYQAPDDAIRLDFREIERPPLVPRVAAVDGGSCVVLDLASVGCAAVRAGWTMRARDDVLEDGQVKEDVFVVTRRDADRWWTALVGRYGHGTRPPLPPAKGRSAVSAWADAARELLEFDASRFVLDLLRPGDVLLVDGSLEEDAQGVGLSRVLVERAVERDVIVAAVSKDSSRSIRGALPFPIEVEDSAAASQAPDRFLVDVTDALRLADAPTSTFGVRWDRRAPVFRLDLPSTQRGVAGQVASVLLEVCNDPTVPGYPYPLARAHNRVAYRGSDVVDLRRAMEANVSRRRGSRLGMRLFGKGRDVVDLAG